MTSNQIEPGYYYKRHDATIVYVRDVARKRVGRAIGMRRRVLYRVVAIPNSAHPSANAPREGQTAETDLSRFASGVGSCVARQCRVRTCRCVDFRACAGGCSWRSETGPLWNVCTTGDEPHEQLVAKLCTPSRRAGARAHVRRARA